MNSISRADIENYVHDNIGVYHQNRLARLRTLKLDAVLQKKNSYLFRVKNMTTGQDIVKAVMEAYLSSGEETAFGEFLEGLAIFVAGTAVGGRKSAAEGIDLELEKNNVKFIVSIKSGPNWGNSQQIKRMTENFRQAKRVLRTSGGLDNVIAVNGCCYGKDDSPDKGDFLKLCGQRFWHFVSDDEDLYKRIIEPLGFEAKQRNDEFKKEYDRILNEFTQRFLESYCDDGRIAWERLVELNSKAKNGTLGAFAE